MNINDPVHSTPEYRLPPDAAAMAAALDALAARDRASIPAGLSARIHRATLPELRRAQEPEAYAFPKARIGSNRGLALAATLALLATVGAVWLAGSRPNTTPATSGAIAITDADVDAWLALAGVSDGTSTDPLDQISADTDTLARSVGDGWLPEDLFYSDQTTEGSL